MKALVLADSLIGGANLNEMPLNVFNRWQDDRVIALEATIDAAQELGAEAVVIAGGLFGSNFISQRYLDTVAQVIAAFEGKVFYAPYEDELRFANDRFDAPETLEFLQAPAEVPDMGILVLHDGNRSTVALDLGEETQSYEMKPLEPLGFGEQSESGYLIVESEAAKVVSIEERIDAVHPFVVETVFFENPGSTKEMSQLIVSAVEHVNSHSCLRIALRGRVPLHVIYNINKLSDALGKRYFYLEVADEIEVGDEDAFADESVSLFGEFLRIIESDDSLSLTEKARIIRCARNALSGKEVIA